jgi:hypothetical protein
MHMAHKRLVIILISVRLLATILSKGHSPRVGKQCDVPICAVDVRVESKGSTIESQSYSTSITRALFHAQRKTPTRTQVPFALLPDCLCKALQRCVGVADSARSRHTGFGFGWRGLGLMQRGWAGRYFFRGTVRAAPLVALFGFHFGLPLLAKGSKVWMLAHDGN